MNVNFKFGLNAYYSPTTVRRMLSSNIESYTTTTNIRLELQSLSNKRGILISTVRLTW
jgi:hypothetical protein